MKLKIEHGIPLPPPGNRQGIGKTSVLRAMEPGDSITVPANERNRWVSCSVRLGKFATRTVGPGTVRIWRLAA